MTSKEAVRLLNGFTERITTPLGFRRVTQLVYARPVNEAIGDLSFICRMDARGFAAFTFGVGLQFESLSQWLTDDREEPVTAVWTPIHFLREDRRFTEWTFTCADDLEKLQGAVSTDVKNLAVPFIVKYSRLDEVRKALESHAPKDWLMCGPERRLTVLAAIMLDRGDKSGAIKLLDEALIERITALPKKRFEIERLRKRILCGD